MSTAPAYPPWEAMLDVDDVNYHPRRIVEATERHGTVLNLGSGVNQLPAPPHVLETARASMTHAAFHHDYDGPAGHALARAAVVAHERTRDPRCRLRPEQVLFTTGASSGLRLAADAIASGNGGGGAKVGRGGARVGRAGARVLVPVPTYPLAAQCFVEAGLRVEEVASATGPGTLPAPAEVASRVRGDVAAVYWNAYNNPTGTPLDRDGLLALARACAAHGALLVVDRVSTDITYGRACSAMWPVLEAEGLHGCALLVSSLSKERCVPGFRMGWAVGPEPLIAAMERRNATVAPSSVSPLAPVLWQDLLLRSLVAVEGDGGGVSGAGVSGAGVSGAGVSGAGVSGAGGSGAGGSGGVVAGGMAADRVVAAFLEAAELAVTLYPSLGAFLRQLLPGASASLLEAYLAWRGHLVATLRRNLAVLVEQPDLEIGEAPQGGFNTFARVPALDGLDPVAATHRLFLEHGVQVLPGVCFGGNRHEWQARGYWTRLSFAVPPDTWDLGLRRLAHGVRELGGKRSAALRGGP